MARSSALAKTETKPRGSLQAEAVSALDRTIHEPIRLGIISALAVNEALSFSALKDLLGVTDGNLSVHARKLEDAGFLECSKSFEGRVPRTEYRVTVKGRRALQDYIEHMDAIIQATRASE